ncbi:MAG: hypothetical protein J0H43_07050 [Actinobacteria bacterium]|nr:hypothetical protein [Actinomycetota bacterium]
MAFCTRVGSVPIGSRTDSYSGQVSYDGNPVPEFTIAIYLAGVEVQARALVNQDPTIVDDEAVAASVVLLVVHEAFHFARNLADLRFGARTGHAPTDGNEDLANLEEALANGRAARCLSGPVRDAAIAVDEDGGLDGYSDLRQYLTDAAFKAGVDRLSRERYGKEHESLLWEVLTETDYSMMPFIMLEPNARGLALELDESAYHLPVTGRFVIEEAPDRDDYP